MNKNTGINTQAAESFNNELKLEIKKKKENQKNLRQLFLNEFCLKFNNKEERLNRILDLIKIYLWYFIGTTLSF
ncbi:hypothetical protein H312_00557 [Anncaliia algerae PRA339]|uniref:Transposase n=1 Tax=Anncaliia algerae PRA339 TaxID=1288291 RepID=A0A059F530_9MICR|nr:hypothetical protein H312_00557 [Anncaliia algerae PRA339]